MKRIEVELPAPLQSLAGGAATLAASGDTVGAVLADLSNQHPLLVQRVLTRGGALRRHVNLFLNDADVRPVGGLDATVHAGDRLTVVPSVAGG